MTKEKYLEMCHQMETTPKDDEIPPNIEDLSEQSQEVLDVFEYLPDKWNSMAGVYDGKDYTNLFIIYRLFEIEEKDWLLYTNLLNIVVNERIKSVNSKITKKQETK